MWTEEKRTKIHIELTLEYTPKKKEFLLHGLMIEYTNIKYSVIRFFHGRRYKNEQEKKNHSHASTAAIQVQYHLSHTHTSSPASCALLPYCCVHLPACSCVECTAAALLMNNDEACSCTAEMKILDPVAPSTAAERKPWRGSRGWCVGGRRRLVARGGASRTVWHRSGLRTMPREAGGRGGGAVGEA